MTGAVASVAFLLACIFSFKSNGGGGGGGIASAFSFSGRARLASRGARGAVVSNRQEDLSIGYAPAVTRLGAVAGDPPPVVSSTALELKERLRKLCEAEKSEPDRETRIEEIAKV